MNFIDNYFKEIIQISELIDKSKINQFIELLAEIRNRNGRLFILGVGGSAGNASHAVNDFRKLVGIEAYSPTDNVSEVTARTNDEGWETVFEAYLKISKLDRNDGVLVFSVGGGDIRKKISVNLCHAVDYAYLKKSTILAVVGRENGYVNSLANVSITIPQVNLEHRTPHSEAFQSIIWHLVVSHPLLKKNSTTW
jgi:D-sedoheptulose 7-phosphate isomerase